jgi:hypothetical protein
VLYYVGRGLASGRYAIQEVLPNVELIHNFISNCELEKVIRTNPYGWWYDDDDDDDDARCMYIFFNNMNWLLILINVFL